MSTGVSKWSADEDAAIRSGQASGLTAWSIAKALGRAESSVQRRIETLATRKQASTRPCMCCGNKFSSAGPHNRLCSRCRTKEKTPFDF